MQRLEQRFSTGFVIIVAALSGACGDSTAMSASGTESGGSTGAGSTGDTAAPTTSGVSVSGTGTGTDSTMGGSDSMTGGSTGTDPTTEGVSGTSTGTTEPGTTTTTTETTGDTTTTTGESTSTTTGESTSTTTGESTGTTDDTTGADTTTGPEVLPGSCRLSEFYGAAGQRPSFTDPAYANFLGKQVAVTTTSTQGTPYVLHIVDISGPPPPPNLNYAAPRYERADWTVAGLGRIYGLTLDSEGNIYVAATSAYGPTQNAGTIKRIDAKTGAITDLITLPNNGPALGNINYDCISETIYATSHEDGRIWQINLKGEVMSTYKHSTKEVTLGPPNDPGEPNGAFVPLGERVWGVQSHAGRLYYGVWWEHTNFANPNQNNEVWSVAYVDPSGVPDPATAKLEFVLPEGLLSPVADISFTQTGRMIVGRRTMIGDTQSLAHQSNVLTYDSVGGVWQPAGEVWKVGELANSSAGGVDHDFAPDGRVWLTGDAIDFYTPNVVYGLQAPPLAGGDITTSTIVDLDGDIVSQAKTAQGDVEVPIPDDAMPVVPPG